MQGVLQTAKTTPTGERLSLFLRIYQHLSMHYSELLKEQMSKMSAVGSRSSDSLIGRDEFIEVRVQVVCLKLRPRPVMWFASAL